MTAFWNELTLCNEKRISPCGGGLFKIRHLRRASADCSIPALCSWWPRTHAARKESTQRPNATASHSWICLLQISRDNLAITEPERWGDNFGRACGEGEEEPGRLCAQGSRFGVDSSASTRTSAPVRCEQQVNILIRVSFGLNWWHEPLIIRKWVSTVVSELESVSAAPFPF